MVAGVSPGLAGRPPAALAAGCALLPRRPRQLGTAGGHPWADAKRYRLEPGGHHGVPRHGLRPPHRQLRAVWQPDLRLHRRLQRHWRPALDAGEKGHRPGPGATDPRHRQRSAGPAGWRGHQRQSPGRQDLGSLDLRPDARVPHQRQPAGVLPLRPRFPLGRLQHRAVDQPGAAHHGRPGRAGCL
ncbi:hypothetical protein D3C76_963410 [compost metagenome]